MDAVDLSPGTWLQTSAGTWVQVTAIRSWTQQATVHNLTIQDLHTYHVSADAGPVLVHNRNCPEVDETSENIVDHALESAERPDGDGSHYVRRVDERALPYYVDGVINGDVPRLMPGISGMEELVTGIMMKGRW